MGFTFGSGTITLMGHSIRPCNPNSFTHGGNTVSNLLNVANAKTIKGEALGYRTHILYLSSADQSGHEVCNDRSDACTKFCLDKAGRGRMQSVIDGRMRKTRLYFNAPSMFKALLNKEIHRAIANKSKRDLELCFRLDGTSDLGLGIGFAKRHPTAQFYDYTKSRKRLEMYAAGNLPNNYHLTFSWSGENRDTCQWALDNNVNVAVPFVGDWQGEAYPQSFMGFPTIPGDTHDLRFKDPTPRVVALKAKGYLSGDHSGFAVRPDA